MYSNRQQQWLGSWSIRILQWLGCTGTSYARRNLLNHGSCLVKARERTRFSRVFCVTDLMIWELHILFFDHVIWVRQCHKPPSPSHHHFYEWYGYHSQSWPGFLALGISHMSWFRIYHGKSWDINPSCENWDCPVIIRTITGGHGY